MNALSELRSGVFTAAHHTCEWPRCYEQAQELAHITHRGMGGNETVNAAGNVLALCRLHHRRYDDARLSSDDLNALLEATWRDGGCAFPTCREPVETRRRIQPNPRSTWRTYMLCTVHLAVTDVEHPAPYRRRYIAELLHVIAARRDV
jgi:hypothetical protein